MIRTQSSKRILSIILVLAMLLSMSGISVAASAAGPTVLTIGDISAMTDTVTYENGVKITQQSRLASVVDSSGRLMTMTVDGVETEINPGTYVGEVVFYVTEYLSEGALGSYTSRVSAYGPDPYRTAVYIDNTGAQVDAKSAEISGSENAYNAETKTISGLNIQSGISDEDRTGSPEFSGVIINAVGADTTETYTIQDSVINLYSDSDGTATEVSDFVGLGAAVAVFGPAKVILDNVDITASGVAKLALFTDSGKGSGGNGSGISDETTVGADVIVKNSTFEVKGGTLYDGYQNSANQNTMAAPPWVLGISGNARATNLEGGQSTNTFVDSTFKAAGWGVLSTDACTNVVLNVINSDIINTDKRQGGYGVYAIGSALETFYGVNFDVATYPVIITGGTAIFTSYTPNQQVDIYKNDADAAYNTTGSATYVDTVTSSAESKVYTTVASQFGVMWHGQGDVTVEDGTVFNTQNAAFLHKNGNVTLSVDNSTINVADGVIVQMIDNDDSTVGATMIGGGPVFNKTFAEAAGFPTAAARQSTGTGLTAEFTNITLTGDMYNATGYYNQTPKAMDITLGEGAVYTGAISATQAVHVWTVWDEDTQYYRYATVDDIAAIEALDGSGYSEITVDGVTYLQATAFTINEYYNLGQVVNQPYSNGYNKVNVTLQDGAVWMVTGACYLDSLTISGNSYITAPEGYKVIMTVDGSNTGFGAGQSYSGEIVLDLVEDTAAETDADIIVTNVTYNQTVALPAVSKVIDSVTLQAADHDTAITVKNLADGTSSKKTISMSGTTITAPSGLLTTLTVDGVQYDFTDFTGTPIPAGSEVVISFAENVYSLTNQGPGAGAGVYENFRMGLYVNGGEIVSTASVTDAVDYTATATGIENVTIRSEGDNFNGILLKNSGSAGAYYTINNANINLVGNGGDDFQGWGAGIMITSTSGNASYVDITNSYITGEGALRSAIWASGQGTTDVNVTDTVVIGYNADETTQSYQDLKVPMMKKVPWALGLEGNNRITSVLGKATVSYIDSIVVAEGWGALSTDSASSTSGLKGVSGTLAGIGSLEVAAEGKEYTVTKEVNGVTYGFTVGRLGESSGYVTYADTGVINEIQDSEMYAPDYIMITAGGGGEFVNVTAATERVGFMWHQNKGYHLELTGGSYTVADTMFMVKSQSNTGVSSYTDIIVDGAEININGANAQSGVLLQLMPSDDAGGIITSSYTITAEGVDTAPAGTTVNAVNASFSNVDVDGDVYNAIQAVKQNVNVTFTSSSVKGVISSSYLNHVDASGNILSEGTTIYATDNDNTGYLYAGRVINTASPAVDNAVNLTLEGSTWTVTGTSYLSSLTVDEETVIVGKIYLNNVRMTVADIIAAGGTISGAIRVEVAGKTVVIDETTIYEDGLVINEDDKYVAPDGKLLTMTMNGVETKIEAGTYDGVVVMTVTDYLVSGGSLASSSRRIAEPYRTAIYVVKSGTDAVLDSGDKSVSRAVTNGSYTENAADGVTIDSGNGDSLVGSGGFSGIILNGKSASETLEYTISGSVINLLSDTDGTSTEVNDFQGLGSAIVAVGDVALTMDNVYVHTTGVAKPALFTDGGADVLVKNSEFVVEGGKLYDGYQNSANTSVMVAPPWVLGIAGNARGTNLLGTDSTNTFVDSSFTASGWGVLSTDGCTDVTVTVINSDLTISGNTGYGIYSIGFAVENFYGVTFDVATYAVVLREGTVTFSSHTEGDTYDIVNVQGGKTVFADVASGYTGDEKPSTVDSQFGVMWHASNLGTLILEKGAMFSTKNAAFLNKDGQAKIYVDDSTVDVDDGVILQMIDDDDTLVGGFNPFNTSYREDAGFSASVYGSASGTNYLTAEFTNVALEGNMYNATGYRLAARPMSITLGAGATLTGVITASNAAHVWMIWEEDESDTQGGYYRYAENTEADIAVVDARGGTYNVIEVDGTEYLQATYFTINEYYNLGHVVNVPNSNGYNKVNVTLKDGAVWTVTGTSYISSLTIDSESSIKAPGGYIVVITVDNVEMSVADIIAAGTVTGTIAVTVEEKPVQPVSWVIRTNDPDIEQRILANSAYVVNGHDTVGTSDDTIIDNRADEEKGTSTYTSSSGLGASALYVTNMAIAEFADIIVNGNGTMSSADTSAEYSSKYGYASAVLVNNGGTLTLYNPTINGIPDSYANGAYSSDAGSTLYIYGGTINTNNRFGHGLDATYGGTIYAEDIFIHTRGSNSGAIATDFQGGFITVNNAEVISEAAGSPGIYTAGNSIITVSNSSITANGTEGVMIAHDGGYTYLYDTDVTGVIGLNSHNSMIPAYSFLEMQGGSLTSTAGHLITVSGGRGDMTLDGVDIAIAEGYDFIGAGQGSLIVTAKNMGTIVGDVTMNRTTYLELNLVNSALEGSVDASKLTLEDAAWTVTGTSNLSSLTIDNGSTVAAPKGYVLTMTVDGEKVDIGAGTYVGEVVLSVEKEAEIKADSIRISGAAIVTLRKNATLQLDVVVTPEGANPTIVWTSSNPSIASVDENGVVTAYKTGTIVITAATSDGSLTSSITVRVIA